MQVQTRLASFRSPKLNSLLAGYGAFSTGFSIVHLLQILCMLPIAYLANVRGRTGANFRRAMTNKQIQAPAQDQACSDSVECNLLNGREVALVLKNSQSGEDENGEKNSNAPSAKLPKKKMKELVFTTVSFGCFRVGPGRSRGVPTLLVLFPDTFPEIAGRQACVGSAGGYTTHLRSHAPN